MDHHHNACCSHLKALNQELIENYKFLHVHYVACLADNSLKQKVEFSSCQVGSCDVEYNEILVCLSCKYYGCFQKKHIHAHCQTTNHALAMNFSYGYVFCFKCNDYQYPDLLETVAKNNFLNPACPEVISANYKGRLNAEEANLLKEHKKVNLADIGMKGIVNIGNTCYISVILQSLVHAPLFRDYFLSLQHKCRCKQEPYVYEDKKIEHPPYCFVCEISDFVQKYFSDDREPLVLENIVLLTWIRNKEFQGYSQCDSHDFFASLIRNLHSDSIGLNYSTDTACKSSTDKYVSIFDSIFKGDLQLKYTCSECHHVTFDTPKNFHLFMLFFSELDNGVNVSFEDSLKKIVNRSKVEHCEKCKKECQMNGKIISKRLPAVLSFHCIHESHQNNKKQSSTKFPEFLDMTPYLYDAQSHCDGVDPSKLFFIFAVVEYDGNTSNGHYKCYVRRNKTNWYLCDDEIVDLVPKERIFEKSPYILFYHRPISENDKKNLEGIFYDGEKVN